MADDTPTRSETGDEALLKEMRDRFDRGQEEWSDIRREGQKDLQYCAGNPWDAKDKSARKAAGRPCLSLDELSQYVNQLVNDVRQNKRAIKVTAMGDGANDETAQLKESLIRQIEYRSNAQQAYTTTFENAVQRSYGFHRIVPKYMRDDSFDQELLIEPIVNPDMVTVDPDALRTDGSDMRWAFIRESRTVEEFKREFPGAKIHDFGGFIEQAPAWVSAERVYLAEYWTLEVKKRQLLLLNTTEGPTQYFRDELASKPSAANILQSREVEDTSVVKYVTNGVEILSKTEWPGKWIPLVCCYGKVLYVDEGTGAKKLILSMIRLARDPFMYYCYIRTTQAEAVGKGIRTAAVGYEGQFRGHEEEWQKANHEPVAFVEARPTTEATGQQVLPLPQPWPLVGPELSNLEMLAEGARRSIQAAIGSSPLPTQAQRRNEKSGVALKQIEETAQKGSFHFIDHYEDAITRTGAILDDLLPHFYDTARDVAIRNPDDSAEVVRINDPQSPDEETGQPRMIEAGPYDVTLSTGPSYDSERELASEFADTLVQTPLVAQVAGPAAAAKVLALAIKLKNLGPLGQEMADTISPPQDEQQQQIPPEVQAKLQEQEQMLAQAKQMIETDQAKQQATIQKAQIDAQADQAKAQMDAEVRVKIATIQAETQIAVAQINAQQDGVEARLKHLEEVLGHKADFLLQQREHAQQRDMGQMQHAQAVDEGERGHEQDMESGEQSGELAERQIETQAAVAPQPEA